MRFKTHLFSVRAGKPPSRDRLRQLGTLFFVLAAVLVVSLPFLPYTQFLILISYLLAMVIHRSRPVIVVLRVFELHSDLALTNKLLHHLERFGRVIWLKNIEGEHPLLRIKRITFMAGMYLLWATLSAFTIFLISGSTWVIVIPGTFYICVGSVLLLEYSVGNSSYPRLIFFAVSLIIASSSWGKSISSQIGVEHETFRSSLVLLTVYFVAASVRQVLYRGFYNQITTAGHIGILEKEVSKRFKLRTRFLLNSPALASEVLVSDALWRQAVT